MYSPARVNQFEMKNTFIEFVTDASRQGNNEEIKWNLKNIWRDCSPIFCEIKDNIPGFYLVLSETYS